MTLPRPLSILIGALGGEGGGVLADWLTRAAEASRFPVQRTSIPGVAQRTGATTYYLEIVPQPADADEFVLALSPVPGQIDLFVASELLEAGRAVEIGLVSPDRTNVIASNHRIFTVAEKSAMGDGRFDEQRLRDAIERFAKRSILFDMETAARESGTAISAVMLGAIAGSGSLPMSRDAFEQAIRDSAKGADANLRGFAAGFTAVDSTPTAKSQSTTPAAHALRSDAAAIADKFPPDVRELVTLGYTRQLHYQNRKYADRYLERVQRVYSIEHGGGANTDFPVTAAVARFLALWMAYEDVIRVADLKSSPTRLDRIRNDVGAKTDEPIRVVEYLKPGIEEWCAILPTRIARRLRRSAERRGWRLSFGLHLRTTSFHGFLLLRSLAGLRWWRPYSARFSEEQSLIERWLEEIERALASDVRLAHEIALCGQLIKGYGETHARGKSNFLGILGALAHPIVPGAKSRADLVRDARAAALADPEGRKLQESLAAHGVAYSRPQPPPTPISWHKSARVAARR